MQDSIVMLCSGHESEKDLNITLDGKPIDYNLDPAGISINPGISTGLHEIRLTGVKNRLVINKILVQGADLRKLLYFSHCRDTSGATWSPCTELWKQDMTWILRFGAPVSYWISLTDRKIKNGSWGQDLDASYDIWWPKSLELTQEFPGVICDFFKYNFDFTAIDKSLGINPTAPYYLYTKSIDPRVLEGMAQEVHQNLEWLMDNSESYAQHQENTVEFGQQHAKNPWSRFYLLRPDSLGEPIKKNTPRLPNIQKFLDTLPYNPIIAFVAILAPRSFCIRTRMTITILNSMPTTMDAPNFTYHCIVHRAIS